MGSGGYSAQPVLCVSDTTLMEDALLAQGIADHKGHAVAVPACTTQGTERFAIMDDKAPLTVG